MPDLRVLTNIPNPYNGALYEALNAKGCDTEVLYKSQPAAEGRAWELPPLQPYERVTSCGHDVRALIQDPAEHTVLSGGYRRNRDLVRLASAAVSSTNLIFWGERLRNERSVAHLRWLQTVLFRPFSCILAIGSWAREPFKKVTMGRVPIHTFPYGLPAPTQPAARSVEPVFGYAGALIERKGVANFLQAVASLGPPQPRIEIVGSGALRQELEQLSHRLGLRAAWFGEMRKHRLDSTRSKWWAQVVPSHYDGWGMVVPEALVSGVPVIATDAVGAARDLVLPGVTGELTRSSKDLTVAMRRLLSPDYQQHLAFGARILGKQLLADRAADWLYALLDENPRSCRSFLDDALACARSDLPGPPA